MPPQQQRRTSTTSKPKKKGKRESSPQRDVRGTQPRADPRRAETRVAAQARRASPEVSVLNASVSLSSRGTRREQRRPRPPAASITPPPAVHVELVAKRAANGLHWSQLEPARKVSHHPAAAATRPPPGPEVWGPSVANGGVSSRQHDLYLSLAAGTVTYIAVLAGIAVIDPIEGFASSKQVSSGLPSWPGIMLWGLTSTERLVHQHREISSCILAGFAGLVAGALRLRLDISATVLPAAALACHSSGYLAGYWHRWAGIHPLLSGFSARAASAGLPFAGAAAAGGALLWAVLTGLCLARG